VTPQRPSRQSREVGTDAARSPELDAVRRLLFPNLSPEEGWARIDAAFAAAADPQKLDAIERIAEADLSADLIEALRRSRQSPAGA
jgi:hypothetical protein